MASPLVMRQTLKCAWREVPWKPCKMNDVSGAVVLVQGARRSLHRKSGSKLNPPVKKQGQRRALSSEGLEADTPVVATMKAFSVGSVGGILGSLAGMGGGFIMVPLMTSSRILGLSQHSAHATSLFAVTATGLAGAVGYGLGDVVDVEAASALACCAMVTARFGAKASSNFSAVALKKGFAVLMLCVAPAIQVKHYMKDDEVVVGDYTINYKGNENRSSGGTSRTLTNNNLDPNLGPVSNQFNKLFPPAVIGLGSGFLAGVFGVGGGALVVPALSLTTDMNHYQALGTSLLAMTFPALVGSYTHYQHGRIALRVATPVAAGALVSGYIGGKVAQHVPEEKLRWGFSALMVVLGGRGLLSR